MRRLTLTLLIFVAIAGSQVANAVSYTHLDVYKRQLPVRQTVFLATFSYTE